MLLARVLAMDWGFLQEAETPIAGVAGGSHAEKPVLRPAEVRVAGAAPFRVA